MEIRVLGRVEVSKDTAIEPVPGRTQRSLLSLLTVRPQAWTTASRLVRTLWPADESPRAVTRLHVQIHRLRRALGPGAIESCADGYRLSIGPGAVDAWRFDRAIDAALAPRSAAGVNSSSANGSGAGADSDVLAQIEAGLAHWGGEPYPDVDLPEVAQARHRLEEMYLRAQEARCRILLDRGDSRTAVDVLTPLAAEHSTREQLQALQMTALHRTGRRELIPEVFDRARRNLLDLGLTPGADLVETRDRMVDGTGSPPVRSTPASPATTDEDIAPILLAPDREDQIRRWLSAGNPSDDKQLYHELAYVLTAKGQHDQALALLGHLEAGYRAQGWEDAHATTLRDMVAVLSLTGELRRALRLLGEAGRLEERTTGTNALLLTVRALVLIHLGRAQKAQNCLDAAGPSKGLRDRATGRDLLWLRVRSQIDRRTGRHRAAVSASREGHRIATANDNRDPGPIAVDLGSCLRDAGDPECFTWFRAAITMADDAGRLPLAACAHAAVAKAALMWQDPLTAAAHAQAGLDLATRCGCWVFAARAAARLGDAEELLGRRRLAEWYRYEALSFYRRVDFPLDDGRRDRLEGRPPDQPASGIW